MMASHHKHWQFVEHQTGWDENIIPPGRNLQPKVDFRRSLAETKMRWSSQEFGYELRVVASDLSGNVIRTYIYLRVLSIKYSRSGLPWDVTGEILKRLVQTNGAENSTLEIIEALGDFWAGDINDASPVL